jgi:hypothetical protein
MEDKSLYVAQSPGEEQIQTHDALITFLNSFFIERTRISITIEEIEFGCLQSSPTKPK